MLFFMSFYAEKRCSATLAKKIQTSLMKPFRDGLLMKTVDKKNDAEFLEKLQESSFLIGADP